MRSMLIMTLVLLVSCKAENATLPEGFTLTELLGGNNTTGFLRAEQPREFTFPMDHAGHDGYRNEWWYITGNLTSQGGRRFGYQVTFFNAALKHETVGDTLLTDVALDQGAQIQPESSWANKRFWMAHVAITDVDSREHTVFERFSRESPGLAGAQLNPFKVWLENWSLQSADNEFPWQLSIAEDSLSLTLSLAPEKNLVLQGNDGLSQKSPELGNASYYYSFTRLHTEGTLVLNGETFVLDGDSWLDREWSTSALASDQVGWDWFSMQFNDGQELMYYQLRDKNGQAHASSQGGWVNHAAELRPIFPENIQLLEKSVWQSPAGINYITQWQLDYNDQSWLVKAVLDDQLMDVLVEYWEGAVDIFSVQTGEKVGQGYLEMVRNPL